MSNMTDEEFAGILDAYTGYPKRKKASKEYNDAYDKQIEENKKR